jgi:hypothetical protein
MLNSLCFYSKDIARESALSSIMMIFAFLSFAGCAADIFPSYLFLTRLEAWGRGTHLRREVRRRSGRRSLQYCWRC